MVERDSGEAQNEREAVFQWLCMGKKKAEAVG